MTKEIFCKFFFDAGITKSEDTDNFTYYHKDPTGAGVYARINAKNDFFTVDYIKESPAGDAWTIEPYDIFYGEFDSMERDTKTGEIYLYSGDDLPYWI